MSTFDLEITFTGLCLYVRDGAKLHVLMPSAAGCHIEKHESRVYTNRNWKRWEELGNCELDLSDLGGGSAANFDLPPTIFDFATLGYSVPQKYLKEDHPELYTRITLMNGEASFVEDGALWAMTDDRAKCEATAPVEMSHQLRWKINDVPRDHLRWAFRQFGSNTPGENPYPRPTAAKKLELHITHAPKENHPDGKGSTPVPKECESRTHFEAYYSLLPSATLKPLPYFHDIGRVTVPTAMKDGRAVARGWAGMVFTCMSAQAPVG